MEAHGTFYWNELMTRDAEAAKRFYGDALGWTFDAMAMAMGTYWVAKMGAKPVGGIFPMSGPDFAGVPEHWVPYIAVDDIDVRLKKVMAGGGTLIREPFEVEDVGRIAIVRDPGDAVSGWMTPAKM